MITQGNTDHLKKTGKSTGTFYFKQFKVADGMSTMKVGTDAVLLGVVTKVENSANILDIGTGSGVIALILAQRSGAKIDAIEIDGESVMQAKENADSSPWKHLINIQQISLQGYTSKTSKKYDLIVSNPPFFKCALKSPDRKRNISRHNDELPYEDLIACSTRLMTDEASFWVILPVNESAEFIAVAEKEGLFLHFRMMISSLEGKKAHRNILQFKKSYPKDNEECQLVISGADGSPTRDYRELTREFYIDF